jgi:hypothetical protein
MISYVLDYLTSKEIYISNVEEQDELDAGIKLWLLENGIRETDKDGYRKQYIIEALDKISISDLKEYFIFYPIISDVIQIVFEYKVDGFVLNERKKQLIENMKRLYASRIGDKYIPVKEVNTIINNQ